VSTPLDLQQAEIKPTLGPRPLKEGLRIKKDLIRAWRKALAAFSPKLATKKKKAAAAN
jgi:hypothetical protein